MAPEQVELWLADPRAAGDDLLQAYHGWLDEDERERLGALQLDGDHRDFLLGRALLRLVLTRQHPRVEPARWRFRLGPWGRPELDQPEIEPRLRFNLSHTRAACARAEGRRRADSPEALRGRRRTSCSGRSGRCKWLERTSLTVCAVDLSPSKRPGCRPFLVCHRPDGGATWKGRELTPLFGVSGAFDPPGRRAGQARRCTTA